MGTEVPGKGETKMGSGVEKREGERLYYDLIGCCTWFYADFAADVSTGLLMIWGAWEVERDWSRE